MLCSYNHLICIDCKKGHNCDDKCPVCKEIIEKKNVLFV